MTMHRLMSSGLIGCLQFFLFFCIVSQYLVSACVIPNISYQVDLHEKRKYYFQRRILRSQKVWPFPQSWWLPLSESSGREEVWSHLLQGEHELEHEMVCMESVRTVAMNIPKYLQWQGFYVSKRRDWCNSWSGIRVWRLLIFPFSLFVSVAAGIHLYFCIEHLERFNKFLQSSKIIGDTNQSVFTVLLSEEARRVTVGLLSLDYFDINVHVMNGRLILITSG
jgi:hypothetical protein